MNEGFVTERRLRQYLLDELPEKERTRVEEQYFVDDEGFERLLIAEDELIDAYVADELTASEREHFERGFLPTRHDRVAFARTLRTALARESSERAPAAATSRPARVGVPTWLRRLSWHGTPAGWALAAAAVVLVVSLVSLFAERVRLQEQIGRLQTASGGLTRRNEQLQQQLQDERRRADTLAAERQAGPGVTGRGGPDSAPGRTPLIASFLLTPRLVRDGANVNTVRIPPQAALLRLQLELESDSHPRYRPVLTTAAGDEVWSQQAVAAQAAGGGSVVVVDLPAALLANRDYVLTLSGVRGVRSEEVAAYSFRVSRP